MLTARARLKRGRSTGRNVLNGEVLKDIPLSWLVAVWGWFGTIVRGGSFPVEWAESLAYLIPKGDAPKTMQDFRAVVMDAIMLKFYMGMILCVTREAIEAIPYRMLRFAGRKGVQTADMVMAVRGLIEKTLLWPTSRLIMVRIDLSRAFDRLAHASVLRVLRRARIGDLWVFAFMRQLVNGAIKPVIDNKIGEAVHMGCGARQGRTERMLVFVQAVAEAVDELLRS